MNVLAIDYGQKRIGLALADSELKIPLPFGVVQKQVLVDLIRKENIDKIVVGLPLGLDNKENANTQRVREFVEELKKQIKTPIEFIDERFSTAQGLKMGGTVSADEKAAMVILQTYLDNK